MRRRGWASENRLRPPELVELVELLRQDLDWDGTTKTLKELPVRLAAGLAVRCWLVSRYSQGSSLAGSLAKETSFG